MAASINFAVPVELGDAGVLAPGKWSWARALGWMLVLFFAIGLATSGIQTGGRALFGRAVWLPYVLTPVSLGVGYAVYVLAVRYGERRSPSELALREAPKELLVGILIGLGMFALVFASLRLGGFYTLSGPVASNWLEDVRVTLATGLIEELLLRAIVFRLLMRAFGLPTALALSAALFGALHLANPNASPFAAIAIAVEAGLMLAGFYVLTGRLWMSVGVHAAWNFAQGPLFGASVSGNVEKGSFFQSGPTPGTPDLLSGGAFGPEASLSGIVVGLVVFIILMAAARRRFRVPTYADAPLPI
jgi:membrane protease YdiL (CAAX protease family)